MSKKPIYKVIFHNQGKIYEIYARNVHQGAMFGFVEIENLVFGGKNALVVDPTEENLKSEFNHVTRTYIPMHSVIRIDEMDKQGRRQDHGIRRYGKKYHALPAVHQGRRVRQLSQFTIGFSLHSYMDTCPCLGHAVAC